MPIASKTATDQVSGTVKRLTFRNDDTGFFVAQVLVGTKEKTVVGSAPSITEGEFITAKGTWSGSQWGQQFKATDVKVSPPVGLEGIVKYLCSAIEGIGPAFAQKLVDNHGEDIFDVIEKTPEKLYEIKGVGKKRVTSLVEAYNARKATREIDVFLRQVGLNGKRAQRVFDYLASTGGDPIERLKKNPYLLCNVWGIGFSTADASARRQGIAADAEYRVRAGLQHVLKEASGEGSCGLPYATVLERASEMLKVSYDRLDECIGFEIEAEGIIRDSASGVDCLFLPLIYKAEKSIAKRLVTHAARVIARPLDDIDMAILHSELEAGLTLEDTQRDAVRVALTNQVAVVTGGPGTGKSTITRVILTALHDAGLEPALCAPTGKAAKRAAEATGFEAKTIHRLLELDNKGNFKRNEDNPIDADVLVIDELSMVDVSLFHSLIKALAPRTRLLLIGDVDQLPSVGAGKVLADILDSKVLPTVRLTQVFRQAATSMIVRNAHRVNSGEVPELGWKEGSDFVFTAFAPVDQSDEAKKEAQLRVEAEVLRVAKNIYKRGFDPIRDVQVLAPMRRGILGSISLNKKLQALLNPHPEAKLELGSDDDKVVYGVGDKVMQLRNNYEKEIFNGDIGFVTGVDTSSRTLTVEFDGRPVTFKSNDLDELTLAYAFTIHKSQGSEFPVVLMPVDNSHYTMLKRNLVYTGITRAKKMMFLIGQQWAVKKSVENSQIDDRFSRLMDNLLAEAKKAERAAERELAFA
jgi:exodeoxyribonuclease V alpha subunit